MSSSFIQFSDINSLWQYLLKDLSTYGEIVPSRNGETKEILGWSATLVNPAKCFMTHSLRKLSSGYAAAELLWYLFRRNDAAWLLPYAPQYAKFAQEDGTVFGAYGARWVVDGRSDQLAACFRLLQRDPDSRQAIITHWYPTDVGIAERAPKKDIPCTLSMQFLVRDGALHMHVNMRSNDAWLGTPYDIFCFCTIQVLMARALDLKIGKYNHCVASMHLYKKDWEKVLSILASPETWSYPRSSPRAEVGLVPSALIAKALICYDPALDSLTTKEKERIEGVEGAVPVLDDPWLSDLLWCMKGKLRKTKEIRGEIVREDLALGCFN